MPIGVVGYLSILQGATYLYEYLYGKIQRGTQESDANTSTKDDHMSREVVNQSGNQSRRRGDERSKAVAGNLSILESELGKKSCQCAATGFVNVTSGASSSSDLVEETSQPSSAGVTSNDQLTPECKDQAQRKSPQKEQGQASEANASKMGGSKTEPSKAQSDSAEDSVAVTPRKEQPKKVTSHEDQALTSEAGTSKAELDGEEQLITPGSSDCSQKSVPTTSSNDQPKEVSSQNEEGPTCECIVGKEGMTRAEPKILTCDKVIKALSATSSKQQLETISVQKDQCTSIEDVADEIGCKGKEQEPSKEDGGPTDVAVGGKMEEKEKESGKPILSDNVENSFQVTSTKEQTREVSEKEESKPTSSGSSDVFKKTDYPAIASDKQLKKPSVQEDNIAACEEKLFQNPCFDNLTKTASSTLGKEQPKKQLAMQDLSGTCAVIGNEKEPKGSSSNNAKENNPTTPGDKQARRELAPKHLGQIDEADTDKKISNGKEPKPMGQGSDCDKKDTSTSSSKEESNNELVQNEETPMCKSDDATKDCFLPDSEDDEKMKQRDDSQECAKKTSSGKRYTLMTPPRRKDNGKVEPSDDIPESAKKVPSGKRYSLMRHPRNKTQPGANPSEPESGLKDQTGEKLPEKMGPTRRAEEKPEEEKPQAHEVAQAEESASPIPSQEQFPTINVEGPTPEVTISTNESKPNIVTVPALSESKAPESLDERSQKETKLEEPVTEMPLNVLVRHTTCISTKKKGLSVRQKFSTLLSTIVEETPTELAYDDATLDEKEVTGSLQPSQGQPNISFPITQEADLKHSVRCDTRLSASSPAFVPRAATPVMTRQGNTSSGNLQITPEAYMYAPATQAALMAASPVHQGTTDNTPTVQSRLQKSLQERHQQEAPTTELPQMSTSSAANNSSAAGMQQQRNISPAVDRDSTPVLYMYPEQLAAHSLMAASPVQQGPTDNMPTDQSRVQKSVPVRHQQEVHTTESPQMTTSSAAYTTYSTALAMQQQGYVPLTVNLGSSPVLYMYPEQLADYLSKAASPVQQGPTDNMPTDQSRMQKSVPVRHQQEKKAPPTACNIPKAAAPLKHQESKTTLGVQEDLLKRDQLTSPKIVQVTNASEKKASPSACNITEAVAPLKHQESKTTLDVQEDVLKRDQLTSPEVVPVTHASEKKAPPTACNIPKAAAPLKHQESKTTLGVQEDVLKKGQVTFPKVVSTTNTLQEQAQSASITAAKAPVTVNEQPNAGHSQSQICASSQAVRPKERGPLAKGQSSNTVETSAADQAASTAKSKLSRSTRRRRARVSVRRRARARQRGRRRAEEAERREKEAEKEEEEAVEGAAATVKETERTDSSNQEAPSSSNEIIVNLDDLYYNIDWETEAARPLDNSTEIFRPRVAIPDFTECDFSQVGTTLVGYLYYTMQNFRQKRALL